MRMMKVGLMAVAAVSGLAFGNGWECESVAKENKLPVEVKVYNYVSDSATKTPAVLILSKAGDTVAVRKGRKNINRETLKDSAFSGPSRENVKYTIEGGDSDDDLKLVAAFDTASLTINGNPDSENLDPKKPNLVEGQERAARLVISRKNTNDTNIEMACTYYVKWQRKAKKAE